MVKKGTDSVEKKVTRLTWLVIVLTIVVLVMAVYVIGGERAEIDEDEIGLSPKVGSGGSGVTVTGFVEDKVTGVGIPDATITFRNPTPVSTRTNYRGRYDLRLSPQLYTVTVEKEGYKSLTTVVNVRNSINYIDFELEIDNSCPSFCTNGNYCCKNNVEQFCSKNNWISTNQAC